MAKTQRQSNRSSNSDCGHLAIGLDQLTEEDGRALAAEAIVHLDNQDYAWSIDAMYRAEDAAQENVVLLYLDKILAAGNRDVLVGFTSVLTDYIGSSQTSGEPLPERYFDLTDYDVNGKPGAWPKMDD